MRIVRGSPSPALASLVARYAYFSHRTGVPSETREGPNRTIAVVVDLDSGWTVEEERFGSFAGGAYTRPVHVRHEGSARGVQVDLEPFAARALLGVPAGELRGLTVSLDDLLGRESSELAERMDAAPDPDACFQVLDAALGRRLEGARRSLRPDVARAWELLRASGGRIGVEALARQLGCSRRHLQARFAEEVGFSPKVAARVIRFEAARARLGTAPLAGLAAELGYADQAHLTREFRALAGVPPTEFPIVQDGAQRAA